METTINLTRLDKIRLEALDIFKTTITQLRYGSSYKRGKARKFIRSRDWVKISNILYNRKDSRSKMSSGDSRKFLLQYDKRDLEKLLKCIEGDIKIVSGEYDIYHGNSDTWRRA